MSSTATLSSAFALTRLPDAASRGPTKYVRPFPSMTVLENLMVSAVYGMRRAANLEAAAEQALVILEELELVGRRDRLRRTRSRSPGASASKLHARWRYPRAFSSSTRFWPG